MDAVGGLVCAAELAMLVAAGFDLHHQDIVAPSIRKDSLHTPAKLSSRLSGASP